MQILVILLAIPIIIAFLPFYIVYKVIQAIYRRNKKKTKDAEMGVLVPQVRRALRKDRALLVSVMADVIKQHWDVLEDKSEQYTEEDDYGNTFIRSGLKREFTYFSEKVVLPELQRHIDDNETGNKNLTLILKDTTSVFQHITPDYFGIKFDDSSRAIADKLLLAIDSSYTDNELLYSLYTQPAVMENYLEKIRPVFMEQSLITLNFVDKLKTSEPMMVPAFVGLVFVLFFAMHNTKKSTSKQHAPAIFTGNDPYKYEEYIKTLLRNEGFSAKRTRGSGDYGVDVIASKSGKTFAIQCKLYNHPVGTKAVQEIVSGRIYYKTDFAIVTSDNSFTDAAKTLARRSDVILVNHKDLLHKIESLVPGENEAHSSDETDEPVDTPVGQASQEPVAEKGLTSREIDELITIILPVINSDK